MERLTADLTEDHLMEMGGRGVKKITITTFRMDMKCFYFVFCHIIEM